MSGSTPECCMLAQEFKGRHQVAPFTLHRFHKNGGHLFGRCYRPEHPFFDKARRLPRVLHRIRAGGPAVQIGVGNMLHPRHQRSKTAPLLGFGGSERQGSHGAAMKSPIEGQDGLAAGVIASQLERRFHRFRAGIAVGKPVRTGHRRNGREPFRQGHHALIVEIGAGHVDEFGRLLLDGGHYFGVAVPRGSHRDSGGKVQKLVAVDVFHHGPEPALGYQGIAAGVSRGNQPPVGFQNASCVGSGQRRSDLGTKRAHSSHGILPGGVRRLRPAPAAILDSFAEEETCPDSLVDELQARFAAPAWRKDWWPATSRSQTDWDVPGRAERAALPAAVYGWASRQQVVYAGSSPPPRTLEIIAQYGSDALDGSTNHG